MHRPHRSYQKRNNRHYQRKSHYRQPNPPLPPSFYKARSSIEKGFWTSFVEQRSSNIASQATSLLSSLLPSPSSESVHASNSTLSLTTPTKTRSSSSHTSMVESAEKVPLGSRTNEQAVLTTVQDPYQTTFSSSFSSSSTASSTIPSSPFLWGFRVHDNRESFFETSPHSFLGAKKNQSKEDEDPFHQLHLFGYNSVSVREEESPLSPLRSLREGR